MIGMAMEFRDAGVLMAKAVNQDLLGWSDREFSAKMRMLIFRNPAVTWDLVRAAWEICGVVLTARECLALIGFHTFVINELAPLVDIAAQRKFRKAFEHYLRENIGEAFEVCHSLGMTLSELAAAVGMPYKELDELADKYFGGAP